MLDFRDNFYNQGTLLIMRCLPSIVFTGFIQKRFTLKNHFVYS